MPPILPALAWRRGDTNIGGLQDFRVCVVVSWSRLSDGDLEVVDGGDWSCGPGFLGAGDGGVDAVDAVLGDGEAEEAVAVFLGVVGECPAGERVGPGDGGWGAADFGEGVEVRVAAGARDDVGEGFA